MGLIPIERLAKLFEEKATVDVKETPALVQEISNYLDSVGFYTWEYVYSSDIYEAMTSNEWEIYKLSDGMHYSQKRFNDIVNLQILANEKSALVMRMDTNEARIVYSVDELSQFLETDKVNYLEGAPARAAEMFKMTLEEAFRPFTI